MPYEGWCWGSMSNCKITVTPAPAQVLTTLCVCLLQRSSAQHLGPLTHPVVVWEEMT